MIQQMQSARRDSVRCILSFSLFFVGSQPFPNTHKHTQTRGEQMKSQPACFDCPVIYSITHLLHLLGSVSGVSLKVKTTQSVPGEDQLVQA